MLGDDSFYSRDSTGQGGREAEALTAAAPSPYIES